MVEKYEEIGSIVIALFQSFFTSPLFSSYYHLHREEERKNFSTQ
jgi:hypothetical protein